MPEITPETTNDQNPIEPSPPVAPETPVEPVKKGADPFAKLTNIMLNLPRLVIVQNIKQFFKNSSEKKIVRVFAIIIAAVIFFSIVAVIVLNLVGKKAGQAPTTSPTPSPSPFVEENRKLSKYATDSAVIKIDEGVNKLDKNLNSTDLREVNLRLPSLDFEVKFK